MSTETTVKKEYQALLTPWKIGNCRIKNRFVVTSMGGTDLFGWMEQNHFDKEGARFILEAAKGGAGLVLPGCQPVYNPMFGQWLHKNKKMYRDLAKWMPQFHKTGAKLFVQLTAGFGRSFTISEVMENLYADKCLRWISKPVMDLDKITASASPSPNRWSDKVPSRAMTVEEIHEFVEAFAECARLLKEAGVDGVEIHAVHEGYLLDQFTLKYVNHRTDEYGGSLENRYRFPVEIVQAIKKACGDDFPVSLRYSVVSKTKGFRRGALPGEKFEEAGRDMKESEIAAKYLQDAGYDMLNCDNGTYDAWYWAHPPQYMPDNCNIAEVEHIRNFTSVPVVCAGRMEPAFAAQEIAAGRLDAVAIARQNLVDPEWVDKILDGKEEDIKPCIRCHNGCFNFAKYQGTANLQSMEDSLHLARCALTPPTMQHNRYRIVPTGKPKKVAIVGGGIGGMECALVLKKRGHTPVIFEKTDELGGMFLTASAMSFKENDRELVRWYLREIDRQGIEVHYLTEVNDPGTLHGYDEIIVATGSVPRIMPAVKGFEKTVTLTQLLREKKEAGDRVMFFGGGQSACEAAYEMILQGRHPIIVEYAGDLVPAQNVCLANASFLRDMMEYKNVPVYLESTITEIGDGYAVVQHRDGTTETVKCDSVVNGIGFVPAPIGEKARNVHRVGDCVAIGNLRTVIWRAWDVCMKI